MLFIHTDDIKYSTVGASFTVTYSVAPDEIYSLLILHDNFAKNNGVGYPLASSDIDQTDCPESCPSRDICTKNNTDCTWK